MDQQTITEIVEKFVAAHKRHHGTMHREDHRPLLSLTTESHIGHLIDAAIACRNAIAESDQSLGMLVAAAATNDPLCDPGHQPDPDWYLSRPSVMPGMTIREYRASVAMDRYRNEKEWGQTDHAVALRDVSRELQSIVIALLADRGVEWDRVNVAYLMDLRRSLRGLRAARSRMISAGKDIEHITSIIDEAESSLRSIGRAVR